MLICLLGLVPIGTARMGPRRAVLLTGVVGLAYVAAVAVAFLALGWILPAVRPLLALGIAAVSSLGVHLAVGAVERQRMRDTFARFVPEAVAGEVLSCADEDLRLGGVQRHATVLFGERDPRPWRHARRVHGRWDHGRAPEPGATVPFLSCEVNAHRGKPARHHGWPRGRARKAVATPNRSRSGKADGRLRTSGRARL